MAGSQMMFIGIVVMSVVVGFACAGRKIEKTEMYVTKGLGGVAAVGDAKDLLGGTTGGGDPVGGLTGPLTGVVGTVGGLVNGVVGGGYPVGHGAGGAAAGGTNGVVAGAQP